MTTVNGFFVSMLTSLQSLLFAAGLRPTPAQVTVVSWVSPNWRDESRSLRLIPDHVLAKFYKFILFNLQVLKDGMEHAGKLICSSLGARMDSEPKRWRILGLYFLFSSDFAFYFLFLCMHIS